MRPGGHAVPEPGAPVLYGHGGERAVLLSGEPAGAPGGDGGAAERRPGLLRHRPPAPPPPPLPVRRGEAAGRAGLSGRTAAGLDPAGRALRQFGRPNRRPSLRTARPVPPGMRHRHSGHRPPAGPLAVHRRRDPPHGPGRHAGRRRLCPQRPLPSGVGGAGRQRPRLPLPGRPAGQDRAGGGGALPAGPAGLPGWARGAAGRERRLLPGAHPRHRGPQRQRQEHPVRRPQRPLPLSGLRPAGGDGAVQAPPPADRPHGLRHPESPGPVRGGHRSGRGDGQPAPQRRGGRSRRRGRRGAPPDPALALPPPVPLYAQPGPAAAAGGGRPAGLRLPGAGVRRAHLRPGSRPHRRHHGRPPAGGGGAGPHPHPVHPRPGTGSGLRRHSLRAEGGEPV